MTRPFMVFFWGESTNKLRRYSLLVAIFTSHSFSEGMR